MIKGDKIVDVRDNSVHIVECVDVYDTVTLVFTEGKKYIPVDSIRDMTLSEQVSMVLNNEPEILSEYVERNVIDKLQSHFDKCNKKFGLE